MCSVSVCCILFVLLAVIGKTEVITHPMVSSIMLLNGVLHIINVCINICIYYLRGTAGKGRVTVFTCLYPYTVQTRPLAGTASGMASDSVRGRGNICGADLEIKSKRGMDG